MLLVCENIFEGETDATRLCCALDKERARAVAGCDLLDEVLDLPPRCDPISPGHKGEYDCRSNDHAEQRPKHAQLIFAQAIAETTNGLDHIARFPKFLAQAAHMRIDGARVDDAFVAPNVVE